MNESERSELSMVQRVARAIDEASQPPGRPDYKILMENCARAAIEAMREPTDLMGLGLPKDYRPGSHSATAIWKAMIDAALKDHYAPSRRGDSLILAILG